VARLLARRVSIPFAGRKYPNLYTLLVTKPAMRKSTTLEFAARHGRYCLEAGRALDGYARRSEIRERADVMLATIRIDFRERAREGVIELNRTELTHRFAANPQRHRALTPTMLYSEVIPDVIQRRLATELPRQGKTQAYRFTGADV
jgi:hypothetical protein